MPRRRLGIIVVLCVLALPAAIYAVIGNPLDPFDNRTFSAAAWRNGDREARARMARSAVRRHVVAGLSEQQLVALLGAPDDVLTTADPAGNSLPGTRRYEYYLGSWSTYGFDDAFLYVHLDAANRVMSAEIDGY